MIIQHIQKFFFYLFLSFFMYSCSSKGSPEPSKNSSGIENKSASPANLLSESPPSPPPLEIGDNNEPEIFETPPASDFLQGIDSKNMEIQQLNAKIKKLESEGIKFYDSKEEIFLKIILNNKR